MTDPVTQDQRARIRSTFGWVPRAKVRQRLLHLLLESAAQDEPHDELFEAYEEAEEAGAKLAITRKLRLEDGGGLSVWGKWTCTLRLGRRALCTWTVRVTGEGQQFGSGLWLHEGDPEPEPPVSLYHLAELGIEPTGGDFPEDIDAGWAMLERHQRRRSE